MTRGRRSSPRRSRSTADLEVSTYGSLARYVLLYRDLDWEQRVESLYTQIAFCCRYGNQDLEKVERWSASKRKLLTKTLTKLIKLEYKD